MLNFTEKHANKEQGKTPHETSHSKKYKARVKAFILSTNLHPGSRCNSLILQKYIKNSTCKMISLTLLNHKNTKAVLEVWHISRNIREKIQRMRRQQINVYEILMTGS